MRTVYRENRRPVPLELIQQQSRCVIMSSIDNMVGLTLEDSKSEVDYVLMLSNSARKVKARS